MAAVITRRLGSFADVADAHAPPPYRRRPIEAVRLGRKTLPIRVGSIEQFIDARPVGKRR